MDKVDVMFEPLRAFLVQFGEFAPRLLLAVAVLIAGWLLAKAARFAVQRALRALNFGVLTERAGVDAFLSQGGMRGDTSTMLGALVYWLVILAALVIAFNGLGLTYITDLLGKVVLFVPRVIVAVLIVTFGAYFARFVASALVTYCRNVGIPDAEALGRITQGAILVFVVLIALDQVNVGGEIVRQSFLIVLAGVVLALALAFGLGGRDRAAELLERWWPRHREDREA
ncbi:MAG: hypothetical protein JSW68_06860 [Burkholderiales bacterium]|nr:MAG: hypothetical protein JSW68_06860 [Burkholderiales bacterium]